MEFQRMLSQSRRVQSRLLSWINRTNFDPKRLRGVLLGLIAHITLGEVCCYRLVQQDIRAGELPNYTADLMIVIFAVFEAVVAPLVSWWGFTKRRNLFIGYATAVVVCCFSWFLMPAKFEREESELCDAANSKNNIGFIGTSTSTIFRLLIITYTCIVFILARIVFLSHGIAYSDEYAPARTSMHYGVLLISRIFPLILGHKMTDAVENNMVIQTLALAMGTLGSLVQLPCAIPKETPVVNEVQMEEPLTDRGNSFHLLSGDDEEHQSRQENNENNDFEWDNIGTELPQRQERLTEKRQRNNSNESEDDEDFITVRRNNKKLARSYSKVSDKDNQNTKNVNNSITFEEEEIREIFQCQNKIVSVKRLKRLTGDGQWVDSETIRMCFQSSTLPPYIHGYGCRFKVEPYTFPVTQCSGCWKYGHLVRFCPTKKIMCPKCGNDHANCETTKYTCLNCNGNHMALDKSCPVFTKEKEIRKIMSSENCSYRKAFEKFEDKKRTFINDLMSECSGIENEFTSTKQSTKRTYRDIVVTEAIIHKENLQKNNLGGTENTNERKTKNKSEKKKRKRNQKEAGLTEYSRVSNTNSLEEITSEEEFCQNTEKIKESTIKRIFNRLKDIVFSKNDFQEKIKQIVNLVIEEFTKVIGELIERGNIYNNLMSFVHG
ncbi:unnamed protein product [Euphydryas editha]|uniref:Uncharacterized protein n=1 Tax=Euphydryas editha TaxID=104508 RepID=A0AAU9UBW8_EUPED|nr:unnamed protein product [Euphydryas editha]